MDEGSEDRTRELVLAAQSGDSSAMEELLLQHMSSLRAFVRMNAAGRLLARESRSDLVQTICREVLSDLHKMEYRNEGAFRKWLFTLASNKLRQKGRFHSAARRDLQREAIGSEPDLLGDYARILTPSQHAISSESIERFESAFDRLSPDHQEVVLMSRILRHSHTQIAERMGRSELATRKLLSRALVALSKDLGTG